MCTRTCYRGWPTVGRYILRCGLKGEAYSMRKSLSQVAIAMSSWWFRKALRKPTWDSFGASKTQFDCMLFCTNLPSFIGLHDLPPILGERKSRHESLCPWLGIEYHPKTICSKKQCRDIRWLRGTGNVNQDESDPPMPAKSLQFRRSYVLNTADPLSLPPGDQWTWILSRQFHAISMDISTIFDTRINHSTNIHGDHTPKRSDTICPNLMPPGRGPRWPFAAAHATKLRFRGGRSAVGDASNMPLRITGR